MVWLAVWRRLIGRAVWALHSHLRSLSLSLFLFLFCSVSSAVQTVREAHDISLALQQSVEQMPEVERAFVHVDWKGREGEDEHNYALIAIKSKMQADAKQAAEALTGAR